MTGLTKTLAKEWGQFKINVNAVAFGFVETRLTQAKEEGGKIEREGEEIDLGIPEQMRAMAPMMIPLGRPAHARGGRRAGLLPLLAVVELRPRPDHQRDRRSVHRHVHVVERLSSLGRRSSASGLPDSSTIRAGGQGPNQLSRAPSIVRTVPER